MVIRWRPLNRSLNFPLIAFRCVASGKPCFPANSLVQVFHREPTVLTSTGKRPFRVICLTLAHSSAAQIAYVHRLLLFVTWGLGYRINKAEHPRLRTLIDAGILCGSSSPAVLDSEGSTVDSPLFECVVDKYGAPLMGWLVAENINTAGMHSVSRRVLVDACIHRHSSLAFRSHVAHKGSEGRVRMLSLYHTKHSRTDAFSHCSDAGSWDAMKLPASVRCSRVLLHARNELLRVDSNDEMTGVRKVYAVESLLVVTQGLLSNGDHGGEVGSLEAWQDTVRTSLDKIMRTSAHALFVGAFLQAVWTSGVTLEGLSRGPVGQDCAANTLKRSLGISTSGKHDNQAWTPHGSITECAAMLKVRVAEGLIWALLYQQIEVILAASKNNYSAVDACIIRCTQPALLDSFSRALDGALSELLHANCAFDSAVQRVGELLFMLGHRVGLHYLTNGGDGEVVTLESLYGSDRWSAVELVLKRMIQTMREVQADLRQHIPYPREDTASGTSRQLGRDEVALSVGGSIRLPSVGAEAGSWTRSVKSQSSVSESASAKDTIGASAFRRAHVEFCVGVYPDHHLSFYMMLQGLCRLSKMVAHDASKCGRGLKSVLEQAIPLLSWHSFRNFAFLDDSASLHYDRRFRWMSVPYAISCAQVAGKANEHRIICLRLDFGPSTRKREVSRVEAVVHSLSCLHFGASWTWSRTINARLDPQAKPQRPSAPPSGTLDLSTILKDWVAMDLEAIQGLTIRLTAADRLYDHLVLRSQLSSSKGSVRSTLQLDGSIALLLRGQRVMFVSDDANEVVRFSMKENTSRA